MNTSSLMSRRRFLVLGTGSAALAAAALPSSGLFRTALAQSAVRFINSNGVRLRAGAGTSYQIYLTLSYGTEVEVIADGGTADGYGWTKVKVRQGSAQGFVASQFLSATTGGDFPVGSTFHVETASGGAANLRSSASTSAGVIASIPNGTNGEILSGATVAGGYNWYNVAIAGRTGWMANVVMARGGSNGGFDVRVADGPLNVRSKPGTSGAIIATVPTGATGDVTDKMPQEANGYVWINVTFHNQSATTGWVAKDFLEFS